MPELPEVETVKRHLISEVVGKTIVSVVYRDKRLLKGITTKKFSELVEGKKIERIIRRGKVLILGIKESGFIIIHLRISGWLIVSKKEEKFARVLFCLDDGRFINFCDQRVLGELKFSFNWQDLPIIKKMGQEVFDLDSKAFIALFGNKKSKIKPLLMDQHFLAGIGNIYAQEAVFCAGVHPGRQSNDLSPKELSKIYQCLKKILSKAIEKKGSSVDTYRDGEGKKGEYAELLKVYQRQNLPCVKCKTKIIKETIGGRGTCFCPRCQN
ncbi:MAG: bifunctional DNA-formamidopyrimidine glycosylase/DNA-(apurinic or apyrimidinic site) lyase [Candidatus Omnitrophica bacterium]|nr:bifunctional DNA-formamidopyrimidine glycosylase/DNA-(apurinic or apyrimidinic site) lyase [Candidatus Omnitrophota bacterium]